MGDAAAKPIIDAARAGAVRLRERAKFYETWHGKNGSLRGADEAWDKFMDEKPIIEFSNKGDPSVNMNNVTSWKDYIAAAPKPAAGAGASVPAPAQVQPSKVPGPAPAGFPEGRTGTFNGKRVIVRNGQIELAE
jgi:hypothetical protein